MLLSNHPVLLGRSRPAESGLSARLHPGRDDSGLALRAQPRPAPHAAGRECPYLSRLFRDIKIGFRRSLLPGCILLAGLALSYFGGHVCAQADSGRVPLLVFLLLWIYAVFSFSMYAIPLAAQLDLPLGVVFRNALILLLARSGQNVAALLVVAACTLLLVLTAPFLLPLALFAHFSFCALVCLCFAEGGLRRCIAE